MKRFFLFLLFVGSCFAADVKFDGGCMRRVYVTGTQTYSVAWAYEKLSTKTCMIPIATPEEAEAILVLEPDGTQPLSRIRTNSYSVTCRSTNGSVICTDSDGMESSTVCNHGTCSSYYGPSAYSIVGDVGRAIVNHFLKNCAHAYLYDKTGKMIWSYTGAYPWEMKLAEAMNCRIGFVKTTYRHIPKENSDSCPLK